MSTHDDDELTRDWPTTQPPLPNPRAAAPRPGAPGPAQYPQPPADGGHGRQYGWTAPPPSWSGPPPQAVAPAPKSNTTLRWIGGGVVAVVGVVAVALVLHHFVQPSEHEATPPASDGGVRADASRAPKPPVPATAMDGLLLSAAELTSIYGTAPLGAYDRSSAAVHTTMADDVTVVDEDCDNGNPDDKTHDGSGWQTVRWQNLGTTDQTATVFQTLVGFADADSAQHFVDAAAAKWRACAHRNVNLKAVTDSGPNFFWTVGDVSTDHDMIKQTLAEEGTADWFCTHVLAPRNNVVVESTFCGNQTAPPVERVVDAVAEKIEAAS